MNLTRRRRPNRARHCETSRWFVESSNESGADLAVLVVEGQGVVAAGGVHVVGAVVAAAPAAGPQQRLPGDLLVDGLAAGGRALQQERGQVNLRQK